MAATLYESRREQMFPKLTAQQIARLEPHGRRIRTTAGQVLSEAGEGHRDLDVVLSGSLEIVRPGMQGEVPITVEVPGDFTGEMSTLRGLGGFTRVRVAEAGEILAISESQLRTLVQTDSEIMEIFMRAFILRRMGLIAAEQGGDVILVGSTLSPGTLAVGAVSDSQHVSLRVEGYRHGRGRKGVPGALQPRQRRPACRCVPRPGCSEESEQRGSGRLSGHESAVRCGQDP